MDRDVTASFGPDERLQSALVGYYAAVEAGQTADREEWLRRYPELAPALAEFFENEGQLVQAAAPMREASPETLSPSTEGVGGGGTGADAPEPLPAIPGYEILGVLGRGGMGVVYKARQVKADRLVALKMILAGAHAGKAALARFRAEAGMVARLQHPNIVQVFDVGEHDGQPFFSMEFVEGSSLDTVLNRTPQSPRDSAQLILTLALAMQGAHDQAIVHRDLKPANILLGRPAQSHPLVEVPPSSQHSRAADSLAERGLTAWTPKITDFGLAKKMDSENGQTRTGAVMGTPSYMAPEQARGRLDEVGPWTDVYALGAILCECLTGRPPFTGATAVDILSQVAESEPVSPRRLNPRVPRDLETICLKCLQKAPVSRYHSAAGLAQDLCRFLAGEPIVARPVGRLQRTVKWARRKPAQAALMVAVLLLVLSGATFYVRDLNQQNAVLKRHLDGRSRIEHLLERGRDAAAAGRPDTAKEHLDQALANLNADPDLDGEDLRRRIDEERGRVGQLLEKERSRQERLAARQLFQERVGRFGKHRDEALFRAVSFRDQDEAEDAAFVRREAPTALKELGLVPERPQTFALGLNPWEPAAGAPEDIGRLAAECYQLLLAWAEAEKTDPRQALALLDAATALAKAHGLKTPRAFHRARGAALDRVGDKTAAAAERGRADRIPVAHPLDHLQAALADYRQGKTNQAAASCEEVLRQDRGNFLAQYLKALCNLKEQRWDWARVGLTACLDRRPGFPLVLALRGIALGELKDCAAADADFKLALEKAGDPVTRAAVLTSRGAMLIRQKRWADARRDVQEAIQLQPKAYQGYANLAEAYRQQGKWDEAVDALTEALKRHPHAALYSARARVQRERGDFEAARQDFEKVLALEPAGTKSERRASALVELAHLKQKQRAFKAALADCDAALVERPDYPPAHRQRAEALLALGQPEEAGKALDRFLAGGSRQPQFYKARGLLHAQRGEHAKAVEAYTQALLLKRDAETLACRGWAYLKLEAPRPALPDFEAAVARETKNSDALCGRGTARVQLARARAVAAKEMARDARKAADAAEEAAKGVRAATADAEAALRQGKEMQLLLSCARIFSQAVDVLKTAGRPTAVTLTSAGTGPWSCCGRRWTRCRRRSSPPSGARPWRGMRPCGRSATARQWFNSPAPTPAESRAGVEMTAEE